jgi:4,5:9,10-diseco-3-hydroxy-5,9,17-trioxoandrosta-1(10),2-diene-4-oate hydrolase
MLFRSTLHAPAGAHRRLIATIRPRLEAESLMTASAHQVGEVLTPQRFGTSTASIAYYERGAGEPFVLLHGGGPGASGHSNFVNNIPDFEDSYRVILPDMPGFGDSSLTADSGQSFLLEASKAIADLIDGLELGQVNLLGNSLGGAVSTRLAIDYPHLVKRLVLMGAAGMHSGLFTPSPMEGVKLLRSYYPDPTYERMRALVRAFVYDDSDPIYDTIAERRFKASVDPGRVAGYRRVSGPAHPPNVLTRADLARVRCPTLLIWGRDDRFVGLDDALSYLAGIEDARLLVLPRCGHWVQAERPAAFAAHLRAFLKEES